MNAALGDAAWMTGMERNSDLVVMSCYAPLFVNVNPGGMQWKSDLIGYNSLTSYGSPAYYVQKIFNNYLGDKVVPIASENIPTQLTKLTKKDSTAGTKPKTIPAMFYVATRSSNNGSVYLKIVNTTGQAQPVNINLTGAAKVASAGSKVVIKADKPEDTNTITEPKKIIPVTSKIKGLGTSFTQTFPAYSVTVLQLETK
jgi:alpha-N-arabinofuranosidase